MSVCFFNTPPNDKYSNLLIIGAFSNSPFSGKTKLRTFPDDKTEILAIYLFNLY